MNSTLLALLALLKRIQNGTECLCPECGAVLPDEPEHGHTEGCELKAQIDGLEAEEKAQTMWTTLSDNFNDQMMALEDERKAFEIFMDRSQWTPEEIERMKARYVEPISFEPPTGERNEGHA